MQIILDQHPVPDRGTFEIHQTITLHVSAEEARKTVSRWLFDEVSLNIGADAPALVVGERLLWRVPTWIGFARQGRFDLSVIEVDATTGELLDAMLQKEAILKAATTVGETLPSFKPFRADEVDPQWVGKPEPEPIL